MFEGLAQPMHLLVLVLIAMLFFGPGKIGEFGKGLGDGIRHFKNALKDGGQKRQEAAPAVSEAQELASTGDLKA